MKCIILALLILTQVFTGAAATESLHRFDKTIPLWQALNTAVQNNPKIQGRMADWDALIEKYREVTGLPDPVFNITYFPSPIETRLGPQDYNVTLSQGIPFPGKLNKKGRIVEKQILAAKGELEREIKTIRTRVIASYAELSYIQTAREVAAKNMALIDALLVEATQRYAQNTENTDKAQLIDVMRAKSQRGQTAYDILLLERLENTQKADLNALMNRPPDAPIGQTEPVEIRPLHLSESELFEKAREHNDTIKISSARVATAEAGVDLAETRGQPDFRLGLFYAGIGEAEMNVEDSGKDAVGVQLGITIPLWSGKNRGSKLAALHKKKAAEARKQDTENQIMTRISKARFTLENASRLIELYETDLLPQSLGALNSSELWYRENKASFSDFLEARSVVHTFQLALARARADYVKTLAELETLTGSSLVSVPAPIGEEAGHAH